MASGKWMTGLTADTTLAEAARHALTERLEVVRKALAPALQEADRDPEHVHQLRVATRRGRAVLDVFAVCLPAKVVKRARRALRDLRRAAGEARDWDVFLQTLAERQRRPPVRQRPGLDFLTGHALTQRLAAQERLIEVGQHHPIASDRLLAETVAAVRRPHEFDGRELIDLARPTLACLLGDLEAAAGRDLHDYESLHQVRIAGKRLRYAMELFADCFAPAFKDELYPAVEAMQEILGDANDSHVACGRLVQLRARTELLLGEQANRLLPGFDGLLRYHEQRLPKERKRFETWWACWRKTSGEEAFLALLKI